MTVDMQLFEKFAGMIPALAERAQPPHMSDAERVEKARATFLANIDADMASEMESCIHCGHCADACHYYVPTQDPKYAPVRKFELLKRVYRRELSPLRWLHRLYTEDINADDLRKWQELVYDSCTECGRCAMICPMGINIAGMVNVMRQGLANAGIIPAEMMAMEQEQGAHGSIFGVGPTEMEQIVQDLSRKQGVEIPLNRDRADILVTTSGLDLLLYNDVLIATARIMNHLGESWTLRSDGFEAANFGLLSGYEKAQKAASERLIRAAEACGATTVIIPECGHAYPSMRWDAANLHGRQLPFRVLAISEYLGQKVKSGQLKLTPPGQGQEGHFPRSLQTRPPFGFDRRAPLGAGGTRSRLPRDGVAWRNELVLRRRRGCLPDRYRRRTAPEGLRYQDRAGRCHGRRFGGGHLRQLPAELHGGRAAGAVGQEHRIPGGTGGRGAAGNHALIKDQHHD